MSLIWSATPDDDNAGVCDVCNTEPCTCKQQDFGDESEPLAPWDGSYDRGGRLPVADDFKPAPAIASRFRRPAVVVDRREFDAIRRRMIRRN
jgi:hypothetical protein